MLILDEPTNNLDVAAQNYVAEVLEKTNRSLIVITHDQKLIDRLNNGAWKTFALN